MARLLFAFVYSLIGFLLFAPVLRSGFVADDWIFLSVVAPAHDMTVCFTPLVGRFVRPLVVLTYFVNYRLFGLWPLPYHVTLLAVHVANAWLVAALGERLSGSRFVAFWSGLLFLVFAGHSEAVSWVAGAADPWLALLLLGGLLLFATSLRRLPHGGPIAGAATVLLLAAYLGKESAAIAPGLVLAWGSAATLSAESIEARRHVLIRTAFVAGALLCGLAAYMLLRARVFGSALAAYADLNANRSIIFDEARAFVLRAFLPPSRALATLWFHHHDVALFALALAALCVLAYRRPQLRGGLLFLVAGLAIGLAPVVPLSISLSTSTSERFVYIASIFSCILIVWLVALGCGRRSVIASTLLCIICVAQLPALSRSNRLRIDAAALFDRFMGDAVHLLRAEAPTARSRMFVLTLPDNLRGTVVVRSAFHPALHVLAPEIPHPEDQAIFIASHDMDTPHDPTALVREGARTFRVTLSSGHFLEKTAGNTDAFTFQSWTPSAFVITFNPPSRHTVIAYETEGRLRRAAVIDGLPFGAIDTPADNASCDGNALRFSGWAMDDERGVEVDVQYESGDAWLKGGSAQWRSGTRPDVTAMFHDFPAADRAEWDYEVPCARVPAGGALRVRVLARDSAGQQTALGVRSIRHSSLTWTAR